MLLSACMFTLMVIHAFNDAHDSRYSAAGDDPGVNTTTPVRGGRYGLVLNEFTIHPQALF